MQYKYWKWWVCIFLFLATLLNYLDRQTISVLSIPIQEEMELTETQLGWLLSAFFWSYGLFHLVVGLVLDRVSVKYAFAFAVLGWSIAGTAAGFATGFWSLFVLRGLLGMFEAANWPAALRITSRIFPPEQRSLANGIFQSATSVAAVIAPPILIFLTEFYNWRFGFITVGLAGIVWVVGWLAWYRPERYKDSIYYATSRANAKPSTQEESNSPSASSFGISDIIRFPAFWGLVLASTFLNPCLYFYITWLPKIIVGETNVEFGWVLGGLLMAAYFALDLGYLTGGAVVWFLASKLNVKVHTARLIIISFGTVCMMSVLVIPFYIHSAVILTCVCLATFGVGWFMVNYLAFLQDISDEHVSTVAGWLGAAGCFSGAILMVVTGMISDMTGSYKSVFILMGLLPPLAYIGIWIGYLSFRSRNRQQELSVS